MFPFRAVPLGAACLCFAAAATAAPASVPASGVPSAALRDVVQRLWAQSPEIQAARAERDAALARAHAAARPLYNPELALDAENADVDRRTAGLSLALDLSGKRRARTDRAEASLRASEAGYAVARRDLAARWLKAWVAAALAERQAGLGQRRVALMRRFDALAAQRLAVGDIGSPERDLAALALGEAQGQQAALRGDTIAARATLAAIGTAAAVNLPPAPDALPPPADTVTPRATDALPELLQAQAEQAAAEAGVGVARRARVPDPTLSLTGGHVRSGPRTDRVIGVSVSIPLPVLDSGRAEVEAAQADAAAAGARLRARRLALAAAVDEAGARYAALREADAAFRSGRAAAFEDRAALLEKLWRAGEIGTSDYLVQLKQSLDTALSGLELQRRAWQAWFDYLAAAGRLDDWLDGHLEDTHR